MKAFTIGGMCGLSFFFGTMYGEHKQEVANRPYVELLVACLNQGEFYFPDTLEAFRCDTTYLGTMKGPYKNEPTSR